MFVDELCGFVLFNICMHFYVDCLRCIYVVYCMHMLCMLCVVCALC